MNIHSKEIVPFSLKDAPSLIERVFPSAKISAEAQKERKAVQSQTLTGLGSYWKGRKPLVLVRACVIGSLLPATKSPDKDLEIFEMLMAIDDAAFEHRFAGKGDWKSVLDLPYEERVLKVKRSEDIGSSAYSAIWPKVNSHLNTSAHSIPELVEQLGIMRFGKKPTLADTFSGGGSIPFEAARVGCDVYASDLNPIACLLTWGSLNILGAHGAQRQAIIDGQKRVARQIEQEISDLRIEHDAEGNRAKAYLYCLETKCPDTGWDVPVLPSLIISKISRTVAKLIPDDDNKRYEIEVISDASDEELSAAESGTLINGRLHHPRSPNPEGVSIGAIRGDRKVEGERRSNELRLWKRSDISSGENDIWRERLYCIQWISADNLGKSRMNLSFRAPSEEDLEREARVETIVTENLDEWQNSGLVPNMEIAAGQKTDEPIRTRGWTYWHHLFPPRHLLFGAVALRHIRAVSDPIVRGALLLGFCRSLNYMSKLTQWMVRTPGPTSGADVVNHVFYNQALNTFYNYGVRATHGLISSIEREPAAVGITGSLTIKNSQARDISSQCDIYITDPPYADAVNYHEISEYFIAWLRGSALQPFDCWEWDSRRRLAIKGKGDDFRKSMVDAYSAMTKNMPDNGVQIVMFTHQDGKVWADMAQIFWGAGLQVMADWYIATETTSELKKGGYVQGTHIIVLRKRPDNVSGYSDEITQEVKEEVSRQIEDMVGLNQSLRGKGRSENLFNDADMQMAGYAAALRVLTKYAKIDSKDMTVEAMRPRAKNERTLVDDIVEFAVQTANEHLVPEAMDSQTWGRLSGTERFYLKMLDIESAGVKKLDNYQNFAKAFKVGDFGPLMRSQKATDAKLKTAKDVGKRHMGDDEFGSSLTRAVLYALWEMGENVDDDDVLEHLKGLVPNYLDRRGDLQVLASYIGAKRSGREEPEGQNATILAGMIKNERLG